MWSSSQLFDFMHLLLLASKLYNPKGILTRLSTCSKWIPTIIGKSPFYLKVSTHTLYPQMVFTKTTTYYPDQAANRNWRHSFQTYLLDMWSSSLFTLETVFSYTSHLMQSQHAQSTDRFRVVSHGSEDISFQLRSLHAHFNAIHPLICTCT